MNTNENNLDSIVTQKFKLIINNINESTNPLAARDRYFEECNDPYTNFITEKLKLNLGKEPFVNEMHHIFPKSIDGPELSWNEMYLSVEDHTEAHAIRAEVYEQTSDILAVRMRLSKSAESRRKFLQKSIDTRRINKITVFDPGFQSQAGKIGGSTFSEKNSLKWADKMNQSSKNAFTSTMVWKHRSGEILTFPPNTFQRPQYLARALHQVIAFSSDRITEKNAPGALSKVIKGTRSSYNGWSFVKTD